MFIDDFIWLPDISDNTALILSARDMVVAERRRYERK
jgi:hypothetical protein